MHYNCHIIIVTYNATPWLKKCFDSIDFSKYKVVVVDNNSQDDTIKIIKQDYSQVKLFQEKENLGFGQANNKGISYALNHDAEQVFLLNQDAYLVNDCLEQLIDFQKQNPEFGVLSPIHTNVDITRLDRNFSNYMRYDMNPDFYSDFVLGNPKKSIYEVPFVNAAGWLMSKECLINVGGFDPIFFHYGEDRNFAQRLKFHDFKMGVVSNTFMVHDREDRSAPVIEPFSDAYFKNKERDLKVKFADINEYNDAKQLKEHLKSSKKKLFKAKLKRNKKGIERLKKNIKVVEKSINEIEKSIKLNKRTQPNYLNII